MKECRIHLSIPRKECLRYYQGQVTKISARTVGGQVIQSPANIIKQFVTTEGLYGEFRIVYGDDHKLVRIDRVR